MFSFGRKLERDDFYQPERMQSLYERVLSENLINGSEVDRQLFYGLLVYVRRQDKRRFNAKAVFWSVCYVEQSKTNLIRTGANAPRTKTLVTPPKLLTSWITDQPWMRWRANENKNTYGSIQSVSGGATWMKLQSSCRKHPVVLHWQYLKRTRNLNYSERDCYESK